jgi:type I restriction enzyme S subunit
MRSQFPSFELREGDVLVSLDRPIISTGVKVACVKQEDIPSLLVQRVGRCQFKTPALRPEYFFEWLRSPRFTEAIDPGRSNGVPHIAPGDIESIPFDLPSDEIQKATLAELRQIRSRTGLLSQRHKGIAHELDALLPSILDKAFRGEL